MYGPHEGPSLFQHLCVHFLLYSPHSSWPFSSPLDGILSFTFSFIWSSIRVKFSLILPPSRHPSVFLAAPSSSRSGLCELTVILPPCSFSVPQWSMREIYSSLSPTGRSFVLIWRHFLKERRWLLQSSASIRPWRWVRELTVPSISPSMRSRGKKDTGHTRISFTMHVIHQTP